MTGPSSERTAAPKCARKGCRRKATQAWDMGPSAYRRRAEDLCHYEVCDKHAVIFERRWIRDDQAQEIRDRFVPWEASA